eukprot:TRINITY_DN69917_c0_g1_i1.p1 TRINITY_DN69917_c0_g1~~TRINITY_DN69917_c0_g1_i1.p1  ORF type:complete len:398 (+),score=153.93 TRINITY_DN69917_c0_g1_i1:88-1194(+)
MPPKAGAKERKRLQKLLEMQMKESTAACDEGDEFLAKVREDKPYSANASHYQGAVKCFNRAVENNAENARAFVSRGKCFKVMQEWDKAVADFTKAIDLLRTADAPGPLQQQYLPESLKGRAYCFEQLGQLDDAIEDYTAVIELQPEDDHAYNMRGNVRQRKRGRGLKLKNVEFGQVIADFTRAIELNECNYHALANRGSAYFDRQEYRKAIEDYSRAMFVKDDYHYMLLRRALAYYEYVQLERAEDAERDKAEKDHTGKTQEEIWEEEFWEEERQTRRKEQQEEFLQQAITDLKKYITVSEREHPGAPDPGALCQKGMTYLLMGPQHYAEARDDFKKVQATGPPELVQIAEQKLAWLKAKKQAAAPAP